MNHDKYERWGKDTYRQWYQNEKFKSISVKATIRKKLYEQSIINESLISAELNEPISHNSRVNGLWVHLLFLKVFIILQIENHQVFRRNPKHTNFSFDEL